MRPIFRQTIITSEIKETGKKCSLVKDRDGYTIDYRHTIESTSTGLVIRDRQHALLLKQMLEAYLVIGD